MPPPPPPHQPASPASQLGQRQYSYPEIDFAYDAHIHGYHPPPPPTPLSAQVPPPVQLLSQTETTSLMGFLDNFNRDVDPALSADVDSLNPHHSRQLPPLQHHFASNGTLPPPPSYPLPPIADRSPVSAHDRSHGDLHYPPIPQPSTSASTNGGPVRTTRPRSQRRNSSASASASTGSPVNAPLKAQLSVPQKRMNHIMSEQKRRNAIREGYSTLIQLLTPESGGPTIEMPTRGRPKGSGSKSKGQTRGKSGILFRAVEFTKWLEEGNEALRREVERLEAATGLG